MSDDFPSPTGGGLTCRLAAQARKWAEGNRVRVEDLLAADPSVGRNRELVLDLVYHEILLRQRAGEGPTRDEYAARFPDFADEVRMLFETDRLVAAPPAPRGGTTLDHVREESRASGPPAAPAPPRPQREGDRTIPYQPGELFPQGTAACPPPIQGRYVLGEEIARGGMGVVYRATDRTFEREVAIKLLQEQLVGTPAVGRFFAEARLTGQLQHPAIPPVHDLGTLADGRPFLAMKLIRGQTLADRLKNRRSVADELALFLGVFEQVCLAVAYAHSRGVIHRDLKPANVMVGAFGEVQVMDWGLAKRLERGLPEAQAAGLAMTIAHFAGWEAGADRAGPHPGPGPADATRAGTIMGTPAYMPPEQANGELDRVDTRSDVFSLGAILAVILTGRPPYVAATAREVWRMAASADLTDAHRRLAGWNQLPGVVDLALRCLDPDPDRRPAHAGEVAVAVTAARARIEDRRRVTESLEAGKPVRPPETLARQLLAQPPRPSVAGPWNRLTGCVIGIVLLVAISLGVMALVSSTSR